MWNGLSERKPIVGPAGYLLVRVIEGDVRIEGYLGCEAGRPA